MLCSVHVPLPSAVQWRPQHHPWCNSRPPSLIPSHIQMVHRSQLAAPLCWIVELEAVWAGVSHLAAKKAEVRRAGQRLTDRLADRRHS